MTPMPPELLEYARVVQSLVDAARAAEGPDGRYTDDGLAALSAQIKALDLDDLRCVVLVAALVMAGPEVEAALQAMSGPMSPTVDPSSVLRAYQPWVGR